MTDATKEVVVEHLEKMLDTLNEKTVILKQSILHVDHLRRWASQSLHAIQGDTGETWRAKAQRHGIALSTLQAWIVEMDDLIEQKAREQ